MRVLYFNEVVKEEETESFKETERKKSFAISKRVVAFVKLYWEAIL